MLFESASVKDGAIKAFLSLFPAHAGVILLKANVRNASQTFPRARGGDPAMLARLEQFSAFSPRTRG